MQARDIISLDLLTPAGYNNSACGYCGSNDESFSYYCSTKSLSTQFYQDLLNRGFRRSGRTLYKPDLRKSCCPHYTIRCDSTAFKASKDQRQALNRFNTFILGDDYIKESARRYPKSKEEAARRNTEFNLCERVHEAEANVVSAVQSCHPLAGKTNKPPPGPAHKFEVTLEVDNYTEEKYAIFENYQRVVHKEPRSRISKKGFENFLCSSPLIPNVKEVNGKEVSLGSFHQCYRIDGRLVAVGVLDLLPQCVSAVYFMYHEDVHKWQLGKLGALREAALALEDKYRYYYMGFYIHTCPKMKYKGDYHPQYILDPDTYNWDLLDSAFKARLDNAKGYVSAWRERAFGPSPPPPPGSEEDEVQWDLDDKMLFDRNIPGVMTRAELLASPAMDNIRLFFSDKGSVVQLSGTPFWERGDINDAHQPKGVIADLVAAVGEELAGRMVVDFDY